MIGDYLVDGDAYRHVRLEKDGHPDWDVASVVGERGSVLFAIDLDYTADDRSHTFVFKQPRAARFEFELPRFARSPGDLFKVDADGIYEVKWSNSAKGVVVEDTVGRTGLYLTAEDRGRRKEIQDRIFRFQERTSQLGFDPAKSNDDFAVLKAFVDKK